MMINSFGNTIEQTYLTQGGENMPRKVAVTPEETESNLGLVPSSDEIGESEVEKLNRLLAAVMNYLADEEVEEIDIEFLLKNTEGLRDWWDQYRESNRKEIEEEIKQSLSDLSLEELQSIMEKIKEKEKE